MRREQGTGKSSRRGSALLIVLGMLAFMVVSAVSFSMFMRQSRVPSSYLRRTASSRYLLKAALANAIARIDGQLATEAQIGNNNLGDSTTRGYCEGVYDDPYPGVGPSQVNDNDADHRKNGGYFEKRVFCPFGLLGTKEDSNGVPHYQTVSTLTLEGLAYLPPAIINEVRIYSRLTRTAKWRNLAYDAGRYAFCAVDVSDCFDINKVLANERRTSAPNQRVNLSSLFSDNGSSLDTILTKWEDKDPKIPFVSVADYNIMAQEGDKNFAPFVKYIGTSGVGIYNMGQEKPVANALFITDTYFPPTNTVTAVKRYNLAAGGQNQPFNAPLTRPSNARDVISKCTSGLGGVLQSQLGFIGLCCLYDYLDEDSRPLSFCLPCTETAAMVCGLGLAHNQRLSPVVAAKPADKREGTFQKTVDGKVQTWKRTATPYVLTTFFNDMGLNGVAAFPFKRADAKGYNRKFKGEALVKVFMGPKDMMCRLPGNSPLYPQDAAAWRDGEADGVVTRLCPISSFEFDVIQESKNALKFFDCTIGNAENLSWPAYWEVKEEVDPSSLEEGEAVPPPVTYYSMDGIKTAANAFKPHDANGNIATWWEGINCKGAMPNVDNNGVWADSPTDNSAILNGRNEEYVPHVLVWVRLIADGGADSGKTVDVVPARSDDDLTWGDFDLSAVVGQMGNAIGVDTTPVLEFRGDEGKAFTYTPGMLATPVPHVFDKWNMLYTVDPRYNFAPENWFAVRRENDAGGEVSEQDWIDRVCASGGPLGDGVRDRDIFMFTSDQEYLQSIGELAFLPNVGDLNAGMDFFAGIYANSVSLTTEHDVPNFANRVMNRPSADLSGFACHEFMWRTYSPFDDDIYGMRDGASGGAGANSGGTLVEVSSGTGDFRVNPFSPDTRVLMAALKDTPADWFFASNDKSRNPTAENTPANRASWAFCEGSSIGAELKDDELADIADAMMARFKHWAGRPESDFTSENMPNNSRFDWAAAFNGDNYSGVLRKYKASDNSERDFLWYDGQIGDSQKKIFGIPDAFQNPLHGVDRKFLYSFWRECFQNRQQLFLVFVRAEPLTVGGAGEGSLASAQLGARGVALVWRDPQPPARGTRPPRTNLTNLSAFEQLFNNSGPHQTRVLFYHQFE